MKFTDGIQVVYQLILRWWNYQVKEEGRRVRATVMRCEKEGEFWEFPSSWVLGILKDVPVWTKKSPIFHNSPLPYRVPTHSLLIPHRAWGDGCNNSHFRGGICPESHN